MANTPDAINHDGLSSAATIGGKVAKWGLIGAIAAIALPLALGAATLFIGIPATIAASILSVGAGVTIGGRIMIGGIADRVGNRPTIIICFAISVVAFSLLLVARELWILYLFAVIFGLSSWSASSIIAPMAAEFFGLRAHGTIVACTGLATMAGGAIGPLVAGLIYDITGSYLLAFGICIAICIIAIIAATSLRPIKSK